MQVFVSRAVPESTLQRIREGLPGTEVVVNPHGRNLSRAELLESASGCNALICTLADNLDRELLGALAPKLRVVATYAVGVNNIDLDAAKELGIAVCNTPDVLTDATAEVAIGLMLACARRFVEGDALTRQGRFDGWAPKFHLGLGLHGRSVAFVGTGRIATRVADVLHRSFFCSIIYHSRSQNIDWEHKLDARRMPMDELVASADFLTLHCPLTPETRHLISRDRLRRMKPTAVLINTSRGPVVDESALVEALRERRIFAAGLDVYEDEPRLAPGLAQLDNVVLLPHIGSATHDTREQMGLMCAEAVIAVLTGQEPKHRVA